LKSVINKNIAIREIATLLLFFLPLFCLYPQSGDKALNITLLEKELESSTVGNKVKLLNSLSEEYLSVNPEKSKIYATNALELARILNNQDEESRALYNLGEANYFLYNYNKAINFYKLSLEIEEPKGNDTIISKILYSIGFSFYNNEKNDSAIYYTLMSAKIEKDAGRKSKLAIRYASLGNIFHSQGDYRSALIYFNKSLDIEKNNANQQNIADLYNSLGVIYYDLGSYEKALDYFLKSLQIVENLQNKQGIAIALNNIGLVYNDWGNKEKALQYYQKSLEIEEELGNKTGIADSYNNIGIIYNDWNQNEIAINYYNKAIEIYEEFRDKHGIAQAMNNIGESYFAEGNHKKALEYLMQSLEMEKTHGNKLGIAQSYNTIGDVYFKLGKHSKAIDFNNKSFQIADSLKLSSILLLNYELFYEIYFAQKNFAKALKYYKSYSMQKDSVYSQKFHNTIAEVQAKYEIDKIDKEKEVVLKEFLEKENEVKTQRTYLVIIFILMIVFGILVYYDVKSKIKANKKLQDVNREISGQKEKLTETLDELSKSEAKYKNLIENSPTGIIYIDKNGNVLEVNKKTHKILGTPNEEAFEKVNCIELPLLKEAGMSGDIVKCIETGETTSNETQYKSKWGKHVYLKYYVTPIKNRKGAVSSLIINIEDISHPKLAEIRRKQSERKYRILVENSLQAMLIVQDGKLIFANSRLKELTQYSLKELTGKDKNWLEILLHPDDFDRAINNVKVALDGKNIPTRTEYRYIRKDGKTRWIETLGSMVEYKGKQAILLVAIDVTARKESETILIESGEKLRKANAMKDKFFSIIAHDLKNPFNSILGFSNLLYEAYDNFDEKQRKTFIKNICEASESTFKLLQNLLEWSRTQTGNIEHNPKIIDISVIVNENIDIFSATADNKKIKVQSTIPFGSTVFADENMLQAVIRNLLSNAIKFTKLNGKVEITSTNSGNLLEVCIADTGVGIKPENIKRLFRIDDQYKTKGTNDEQGTGLGLILCKEFVEKNGGKIWAESEFEAGSKFKFTLPVHPID